jgi:hypothetical protein
MAAMSSGGHHLQGLNLDLMQIMRNRSTCGDQRHHACIEQAYQRHVALIRVSHSRIKILVFMNLDRRIVSNFVA